MTAICVISLEVLQCSCQQHVKAAQGAAQTVWQGAQRVQNLTSGKVEANIAGLPAYHILFH